MAKAGLSFANPFLEKVGIGEQPNPYAPFSPTSDMGMGGLAPSAVDMAVMGEQLVKQSQFTMPEMKAPPSIGFSASQRKLFVQGSVFDADDATTALESEKLLGMPGTGLPTEGDWTPLSASEYGQFLESIRNPSRGRLLSKGFDTGVQQLKQLGGSALQLMGAEETGGGIVASAEREIQKRAPFQRQFTDVESASGLVDWFVANLGQQGPMLIESVALGLAGAAAGTATAGPGLGTAGGFLAGVVGKKAFKDKVLDAAAKYRAGQVGKDSAEFALLRKASALTGATAANYAGSLAMGGGDIYGALREQGAGPEDFQARLIALAGSLPYAAAESLSEFVLAGRVLGNVGAPRAMLPGTSVPRRGAELLRRGAVGAGVGGVLEGSTEVIQEGLVMGLSGQSLTDDAALNRFINSFAAGAAVGGAIGGVANLRGGSTQEINLLDNTDTDAPTPAIVPGETAEQQAGFLPRQEGDLSGDRRFRGDAAPGVFGAQGVLDLGVDATTRELRDRAGQTGAEPSPVIMQYNPQTMREEPFRQVFNPNTGQMELQPVPASELPAAPAAPADPRQGALQFAPEAPGGIGFTDQQPLPNTQIAQQLQAVQQQQQMEQMRQQQAVQAQQQAAQQAAEVERQQNLMLAEQQLQIAQQAEQEQRARDVAAMNLPMRQAGPTQPQQLDLFTRRQAPVPSRAEGLRRGVGTGLPVAETDIPLTAAQRRAQIPLFTQAGEPSVAALKSVARREQVKPAEEKGATQAAPTGKRLTPAAIAKARAEAEQKETDRKERTAKGAAKLKAKGKEKRETKTTYRVTYDGKPATVTIVRLVDDPTKIDDVTIKVDGERLTALSLGKQGVVTDDKMIDNLLDTAIIDAKGEPSAIQEPSTTSVDVQEQPGDGQGVRGQDAAGGKAPRKAETLKKGKAKVAKVEPKAAPKPAPKPAPKAAPVTQETAAEKWDNERLAGDVSHVDLPQSAKTAWEKSDRSGAAQIVILQQLADDVLPMSDAERFNYNMALADEAIRIGDNDKLMDAMSDPGGVVETAFFTQRGPNTQERINEAQAFLEDADLSDAQRKVVADAFVMLAEGQRLDAYTKGGKDKGAVATWYALAKNTSGLLQRLAKADVVFLGLPQAEAQVLLDRGLITKGNLPDSTVKALGKSEVNVEQEAGSKPQISPAVKLAEKIRETNKSPITTNAAGRTKITKDLAALWKQVRDANLAIPDADPLLGQPLSAFFDDKGQPITNVVDGKLRVATEKMTKDQIAEAEARIREERQLAQEAAKRQADEDVRSFLDDWTDEDTSSGRYFTDDNKSVTVLPMGRIKLLVSNFLGKLAIKPKVSVFQNQADFKAKNPALYAKAVAARPQGDFDTAAAVGYSFGDGNVIIFADRVKTAEHLNFVLAHEALGHFGLRTLIPAKKFDALMNSIYDQSSAVRDGADAAMAERGIGKAEAVEEYLADFAAQLDVSLVSRIWNAIKGAMNKLGVRFGDEAARYWIDQSRRLVRNGDRGQFFATNEMIKRLSAIENGGDPDNTGRYALTGTLRGDNILADLTADNTGGNGMSMSSAVKTVRDSVGDTFDSAEKFKAKVFSLFNYRARENAGLAEMDSILRAGRGFAMSIKNAANEKMRVALDRAVELGGMAMGGITNAQTTSLNKLLYDAQRFAVSRRTATDLGRTPLFTISDDGRVVANEAEWDRVYNMGLVDFEQARDGFSYEVTYESEGELVSERVQVPGIAGLTEDSSIWQGYLRTRETMRDVELQLLRARYSAYTQDRDLAFREIGELTDTKKLTKDEKAFFDRMYRKYRDLYVADQTTDADGNPAYSAESMGNANDFLVKFNSALIGKEADRNADVAAFFAGPTADTVVADIEAFKTRFIKTEENKFSIQNRIKDIIMAEVSNDGADIYTKSTLANGYTPLLREGDFQVRVVATVGGRAVRLKQEYKEQLVYSQVENQSDAKNLSDRINGIFGDTLYKVEAFNEATGKYELVDAKLQAVPEAALTEIATPPDLNLNEFVRGLRQFSIALPPQKMKEVIVAMTRQNSSARNRLKRAFTPGASPDALKALSQHIESRASTAAKVMMRPRITELMNLNMVSAQKKWNGDAEKLAMLKKARDAAAANPNATEAERKEAERDYELYNFQYTKANPPGGVKRGNVYYNEASSVLQFLDNNKNVDESDFGSGKVASNIRAYTSLMQLGGSIATGALNYIGTITNGLPYLATYNPKTAFGGGFGLGRTVSEFQRALSQVGLIRSLGERGLNTAEFFDKMAKDAKLLKQYGLTSGEAQFMAREIREGEMIPALSNALVGSARGRVTLGAGQKAMDGYMWTFNVTEQASRRALGLSAYRMQYERSIAAGKTQEDAANTAREFAVSTLRFTVGDYSVTNRPPVWQSGIQSFIYMYKVFPTTSIQLLSRLPRSGQMYMLGSLWMLGGLTAMPFAEDIEDIIDSISQALGLKAPSVRAELARTIDAIAPGASPFMLRGFANAYFPGNIADRVSLSNFIPGTGILLAGSDVGRELTEIAGPAASMLTGVATAIPLTLRAAFTDRVTFVDAMRESPVTMARAFGDTLAFGQAGAVVDKRGYVVTPDMSAATLVTRMLGFYPAAAAEQYGIIRVSRRIGDYHKDVVAGYRSAWIKATLAGDTEQAQNIVDSVADWNEGARGTALEIRRFLPTSRQALREARRPASERMLRSASRSARSDLEELAQLLGYNED